MTEETTTEQLVEIEGQAAEYTPPEGWRVVEVGERLRDGDMWVSYQGESRPTKRVGERVNDERYIRPIEPKPQPQPQPQPEPKAADTPTTEYTPPEGWRLLAVGELVMLDDQWVRQDGSVWRSMGTEGPVSEGARYIRRIETQPVQVREGRWRTRAGEIRNVTPTPEGDGRKERYPWWDAQWHGTWTADGRYHIGAEGPLDLVEYLGPIEQQPQPDAELRIRLLKEANDSQAETIGRLLTEARDLNMEIGGLERRLSERDARIRDLETMHAAATQAVVDAGKVNDKLRAQVEELRSEVAYVQNLLGTERRRVAELEELASSLRTINETQEKAFTAAGKENTALRNQLAAVKAELANVAADRQRLQIELDAAQQVPAGSPEVRQLRLDLAEVTLDRDQYKDAYTRLTAFVETVRETAKAEAVEAIVEWLVPIRTCGSQALATAVISNLPHIMRSLTGLEDEGIE